MQELRCEGSDSSSSLACSKVRSAALNDCFVSLQDSPLSDISSKQRRQVSNTAGQGLQGCYDHGAPTAPPGRLHLSERRPRVLSSMKEHALAPHIISLLHGPMGLATAIPAAMGTLAGRCRLFVAMQPGVGCQIVTGSM
jgi:hypothetical protein